MSARPGWAWRGACPPTSQPTCRPCRFPGACETVMVMSLVPSPSCCFCPGLKPVHASKAPWKDFLPSQGPRTFSSGVRLLPQELFVSQSRRLVAG